MPAASQHFSQVALRRAFRGPCLRAEFLECGVQALLSGILGSLLRLDQRVGQLVQQSPDRQHFRRRRCGTNRRVPVSAGQQGRLGRWADFPSFRYSFCSWLGQVLPLQKVRVLMRHSTMPPLGPTAGPATAREAG